MMTGASSMIPATPAQARACFRAAATAVLGGNRAGEIERLVDGLETAEAVSDLLALTILPN